MGLCLWYHSDAVFTNEGWIVIEVSASLASKLASFANLPLQYPPNRDFQVKKLSLHRAIMQSYPKPGLAFTTNVSCQEYLCSLCIQLRIWRKGSILKYVYPKEIL
jgi:hypothetical protein